MPNDRTAADDRRCKTCVYHSSVDNIIICEYILVTGHRRGCRAGVGCLRYIKGDNRNRYELGPSAAAKPKQTRNRPDMGKLNQAAYQALLQKDTAANIAQRAGCGRGALWNYAHRGRIKLTTAEKIREIYGIDLIDRTPS